jgi:hypothetical protein
MLRENRVVTHQRDLAAIMVAKVDDDCSLSHPCPRRVTLATQKSWLSGKRRIPIDRMRAMADAVRHDLAVGRAALLWLEVEIGRRERKPPRVFRRQGFGLRRRRHPHKPSMAWRTTGILIGALVGIRQPPTAVEA